MRKIHLPWQRGTEAAEPSSASEASPSSAPAGPYFKQNMSEPQPGYPVQDSPQNGLNPGNYGNAPFQPQSPASGFSVQVQPAPYTVQTQTGYSVPSAASPYAAQPQTAYTGPNPGAPYSPQSPVPGFSGSNPAVPYAPQSQVPGFSGPNPAVPYAPQSQVSGFSGPNPAIPYTPQSPASGFSGPNPAVPFTPQSPASGFSGPNPAVPYPGQSQVSGFSGPNPAVPYTAESQVPGYSGPNPAVPYTAQSQVPSYSGPNPAVPYPGQSPTGGYSRPVQHAPSTEQTGDPQSVNPPESGQKQPVKPFSFTFRPSFIQPDNLQKKLSIAPIHIAIIFAVVLLAGWYLFNTYAPQAATSATVQAGKYGAYYTGDALIVRNEVPYDADGVTSIDYKAAEGSFINNSTTICDVFSSGFSTKELTTLQDYRDQIRDYEQELLGAETTYDARLERVESEVLTQAKEVRSMLAGTRGNLINQESTLEAAITARQQYLRQKYSSDQRLSRLLDDEQAQQQRIDSWTKTFYGTRSSLVSFYTDGYEYGLTVQNCLDFTPSQVRNMINGQVPESSSLSKSKTTIYRTIMDEPWYVLMLVHDTSWNPVENATYTLELNQFENTQVEATVISFTRSGGELLVRLRVENNVNNVLYMRTGTARLGDNVSTMMVPSRAIYRQNDMDGVVVIDGSNRFFVPVQIIFRDGNDVYVNSLQQGLLFEGQSIMLF
ncbi:MAG: hypothetical protein K6A68_03410 [Clostridiales bacterium]|nr:hypothetical protein [Clostridiales bacterium]